MLLSSFLGCMNAMSHIIENDLYAMDDLYNFAFLIFGFLKRFCYLSINIVVSVFRGLFF